MCRSEEPIQPPSTPEVKTFDSAAAFLDAVQPGMGLCTSDFAGWGEVTAVVPAGEDSPGHVVGTVRESGATVHIPADVLVDLRGGHCVRLDRTHATINSQGWEVA